MKIVTVEKFLLDALRMKIWTNKEYSEMFRLKLELSELAKNKKKQNEEYQLKKEQYEKLGGEKRRVQLLKEIIKETLLENKGNEILDAAFISSMSTGGGLYKQASERWPRMGMLEANREVLFYTFKMIDKGSAEILRDDVYRTALDKVFAKLAQPAQTTVANQVEDKKTSAPVKTTEQQSQTEGAKQADVINQENEEENNI